MWRLRGPWMVAWLGFVVASHILFAPAWASIDPIHFQRAREKAAHHVQVRILAVMDDDQSGACRILGEVVRVFRTRAKPLAPGHAVNFELRCRKPDDPPLSCVIAQSHAAVHKAHYVEVFLDEGWAAGDAFMVAMEQARLIALPTAQSQIRW